jgi:hypothetical protein
MLSNVQQDQTTPSAAHGEALTWGGIFSVATLAIGLMFWMGAASNSGEPVTTVVSIGISSLLASGIAARVAVKFSKKSD